MNNTREAEYLVILIWLFSCLKYIDKASHYALKNDVFSHKYLTFLPILPHYTQHPLMLSEVAARRDTKNLNGSVPLLDLSQSSLPHAETEAL